MTVSKSGADATKDQIKTVSNENLARKIVIRRLPPTMTKEQFLDIVSPLPEYDYMYYCNADMSLGLNAFCRAYIYFKDYEEIFSFRDRFDNYVFVDAKSNEYPAIVEFAPYQRRFKFAEALKNDSKCNTIDEDSDYLKFLENFDKPSGDALPSCETILEELEQRERDKEEANTGGKVMTPLLEYMRRKREDKKQNIRERERESKKRREDERRYNNSSRDKRRDRDRERDYNYNSSKDNKSYGQSDKSAQQNIKIMAKPKYDQQSNSAKNTGSTQNTKTDSHQKGDSKSFTSSATKSNSSHGNSYRDRDRDRERDNKSGSKSYGSGKASTNNSSRSYRNYSDSDNRTKYQNSNEKADKTNEKSEKSGASASIEANSAKKQSNEGNNESKQREAKEGKPLRNKERPSIQIYNPGQRAALREQKKEPAD